MKLETMTGSGRKTNKGGNVIFYNDSRQLLKKLEIIVGEISAGNTSVHMKNTGVSILNTLLRRSTINNAQHEKLQNIF